MNFSSVSDNTMTIFPGFDPSDVADIGPGASRPVEERFLNQE